MFTGLIASIGKLTAIARRGDNLVFRVAVEPPPADLAIGESIALDGYCQTVVAGEGGWFEVEVSPETVARTTAGRRRVGDRLNLERAMRLSDRLGGHLVAGHVDEVGTIARIEPQAGFVRVRIAASPMLLKYCVPKGSIAVDGVSLTLNQVDETGFEVGVIPHTWSATTLAARRVGDEVNLEADLIGKYVEKFMAARLGGEEKKSAITAEFLAAHGFVK